MEKVNVKEMTGKLNQLRMGNLDKLYTHDQLFDELRQLGFAVTTAQAIMSLIPSEKIGRNKFYQFSKDPIHVTKLEEIYKRSRNYTSKYREKRKGSQKPTPKPTISQEDAIKCLQSSGYQIRKCVGFDEARFKEENPELYQKYLKYEDL